MIREILLGLGLFSFVLLPAGLVLQGLWISYRVRQAALARNRRHTPVALRVVGRRDFTDQLFELTLAHPRGQRLRPSQAGQYLPMLLPAGPNGGNVRRCYSLASWSLKPKCYTLTIKREPQGVGSGWLHSHANVGTLLQTLPPEGHFVLKPPTQTTEALVLIAGGIGITPMRAMLQAELARYRARVWGTPRLPRPILLIYAARHAADLCYRAEFEALAAQHPHFRFIPILSQPEPGWTGASGHLSAQRLLAWVPNPDSAQYYCCASTSLMKVLAEGLAALGVPPQHWHQEAFGLAQAGTSGPPRQVQLQNPGQTSPKAIGTFEGQPTLYHFLEATGIPLGGSCRAGQCRGCQMRVLSGSVNHLLPCGKLGLRPDDCLPCVCVPASDVVLAHK